MPPQVGTYLGTNHFLEFDGAPCGFLKSVTGGGASADVVVEAIGPGHFAKKHLGLPFYEDIQMQIGFDLAGTIYRTIASTWKQKFEWHSGEIIAADYKFDRLSVQAFQEALISSVTIPGCDGAAKAPAYLSVSLTPTRTKIGPATGALKQGSVKSTHSLFLPCNFKLDIDGLKCDRVSKIDPFTVAVDVERSVGLDTRVKPNGITFPNLRVTLAAIDGQTWLDWFQDFVVYQHNDETKEKGGTLTLLSPDFSTPLGRVKFHNLGIFRIGPVPGDSLQNRLVADLYCEAMDFECPVPTGNFAV
jgi:hypothetical protein